MTDEERLAELKVLILTPNANGNDSSKRAAALEAIAGPAGVGGRQTTRLLKLAIAIVEGRIP